MSNLKPESIVIIFLSGLPIAYTLVINSYSGYSQGYSTTPSFDGDDTIYLLGGTGDDSGIFDQIWKYSISKQEFAPAVPIPSRVEIRASFGAGPKNNGDIYFFSTTNVLHKFSAKTRRVSILGQGVKGLLPGFTALLQYDNSIFYITDAPEGPKSQGAGALIRLNFASNVTSKVADIPNFSATRTVLASDENRNLYVFGGEETENYKLKEANSTYFKIEVMKVKLHVDDIISNVIQIGKFILFFSNHFDLVTINLQRQLAIIEKLEFQHIEKIFYRFNAVYVEKQKRIYIFACGGRIRGCTVLTISTCPNPIVPTKESVSFGLEKADLTLVCNVSKSPKPFIQWKHNGKLKSSAKIDNDSNLVLSNIGFGHSGIYSCEAESICGSEVHQIHVIVKHRTVIEKWKSEVVFRPGKTARLGCKPTKENWPLTISWLKGDTVLEYTSASRYRTKEDNGLAIFEVEEADSGYYTCLVQTSRDSVNATVHLIVRDDPPVIDPHPASTTVEPEAIEAVGSSVHFMPALIAAIVTGILVLGICIVLSLYWFWKYKKAAATSLTADEIREFRQGRASTTAAENNYSLEEFTYGQPYDTSYELALHSFEIQREIVLGQGEFGIVYQGVVKVGDKLEVVAFKTMKSCTDAPEGRKHLKSLLSELKLMIYIGKHPNVIRLIGACTRQLSHGIAYVASELCPNGSLERLLQKSRHILETEDHGHGTGKKSEYDKGASVTTAMQCEWSLQIAKGMEYLTTKKIIHSDLATRNILVANDLSIRITDFGLSRKLENYKNYVKQGGEPLPWRWMAPESLERRNFSTESDIWSYGVTLWEIYSMGSIPFPGEAWTLEFVRKLKTGERLPMPVYASDEIYNQMNLCWNFDPTQRPAFKKLVQFFQQVSYKQQNIIYLDGTIS